MFNFFALLFLLGTMGRIEAQGNYSVLLDFSQCKVMRDWTLNCPDGEIHLAGERDGTKYGPDTVKPWISSVKGKPALWMEATGGGGASKDRIEYLFLRHEINVTRWSAWDLYFPTAFQTPRKGSYFIPRQW